MKIDNYKLVVGNATDVGQVRKFNEDYMAHFGTTYGYCIIVCDGMGGHTAGDVASQAAIDAIKHYLQDGSMTKFDTATSLLNSIEFANYKLKEMVTLDPSLSGMGTTCVLAMINGNEMHVAHAGDSRLYLIRKNNIIQVSKDHSTVQMLIDAGALTEEESKYSDKRNQITKAIGIFDKVAPSVTSDPILLNHGDKIVLCSDGLTSHVETTEIARIIKSFPDVQTAALKLVEKANTAGGTDNITVQIVEYIGKSPTVKKVGKARKTIFLILAAFVIALASYSGYYLVRKSKDDSHPANVQPNDTASTEKKDTSTVPLGNTKLAPIPGEKKITDTTVKKQ
ncbi:MAG: Stp1/IreP family PP2C-type Ser/Thr phosphatase [Bacteroidales bacterium]